MFGGLWTRMHSRPDENVTNMLYQTNVWWVADSHAQANLMRSKHLHFIMFDALWTLNWHAQDGTIKS